MRPETDMDDRLAGAPISWGVCEVPGWGRMLPPERVFAEMAELGLRATELGPIGYLPYEPQAIRERLDRHGLRLIGGFVPLVLHERDLAPTRADAERSAAVLAEAGAELFVAAIVADGDWSPPRPLDDERALAATDAGWCLDTGHLVIGGFDPADFVRRHGDRIVHVHLKDVDAAIAARLRGNELSLVEATQAGLFRPLGRGDARIDEVVDLLHTSGYERWLVLEQDTAITGEEPPVGSGPVTDVRTSIEYLHSLAPAGERV